MVGQYEERHAEPLRAREERREVLVIERFAVDADRQADAAVAELRDGALELDDRAGDIAHGDRGIRDEAAGIASRDSRDLVVRGLRDGEALRGVERIDAA